MRNNAESFEPYAQRRRSLKIELSPDECDQYLKEILNALTLSGVTNASHEMILAGIESDINRLPDMNPISRRLQYGIVNNKDLELYLTDARTRLESLRAYLETSSKSTSV